MSNGPRDDEAGVRNGGVPAGGGTPLGKELLQRELLAVCVGDERDRAQAAAAAGGLAGKEDRVPMAEAEGSVATKAPMPTAARMSENAMMARRAVGSARRTISAAEMFRNLGRRATCTPSL